MNENELLARIDERVGTLVEDVKELKKQFGAHKTDIYEKVGKNTSNITKIMTVGSVCVFILGTIIAFVK